MSGLRDGMCVSAERTGVPGRKAVRGKQHGVLARWQGELAPGPRERQGAAGNGMGVRAFTSSCT